MTVTSESENLVMNRNAGGYTIIQLVIVVAIISVVCAFAVLGITKARASIRLSDSTRQLAGYLEKARSDAVRRHATTSVTISNNNSYSVMMDFGLNNAPETRSFNLMSRVQFKDMAAGTSVVFDWRGRVPNEVGISLVNENQETARINVSGAGDITLDSEIFLDSSVANVPLNTNVNPVVAAGGSKQSA